MRGLKLVLLRSFNRKRFLILSSIDGSSSITSLLTRLSENTGIPISTLKLNANALKDLGLVEFNGAPARVTELGKLIMTIIR
jgi:DNA-binding IclR family transcriptional regulator